MNEDFFKEYLSSPEIEPLDQFRAILNEASGRQFDEITTRLDSAEGLKKQLIYEEGVEARLIQRLGDELVLTALYHLFEKKIKEVIQYKERHSNNVILDRWDRIKKYIPRNLIGSRHFVDVNRLRLLVNCFKHSGFVSKKLFEADKSFGNVDDHIDVDLAPFYDTFKYAVAFVVRETYLSSNP